MTKDAAELIKKAKESVSAAELLISQGYNDFAVSRAYYAMFYVAEACLSSLGQSFSSHSAVHSAFGREFAKQGRLDPKFHRWLLDARDMRNVGETMALGWKLRRSRRGQCASGPKSSSRLSISF